VGRREDVYRGVEWILQVFYVYRKQVIILKWYVICLFEIKNVLYVIWNLPREDDFELKEGCMYLAGSIDKRERTNA